MILAADIPEPAPVWLWFVIPAAFAIVFPDMTVLCIGSPKVASIALALPGNLFDRAA